MFKQIVSLFLALLLLAMAGFATAGPFEDAEAAYKKGDYVTAKTILRTLAEQGNAAAQYNLGVMYTIGEGVPQDYAEAMKWYQLAADQGNADAQFSLGVMYYIGEGVPKDLVRAHFWFILTSNLEYQQRSAADMPPDQIAEAQRLAQEWEPK